MLIYPRLIVGKDCAVSDDAAIKPPNSMINIMRFAATGLAAK